MTANEPDGNASCQICSAALDPDGDCTAECDHDRTAQAALAVAAESPTTQEMEARLAAERMTERVDCPRCGAEPPALFGVTVEGVFTNLPSGPYFWICPYCTFAFHRWPQHSAAVQLQAYLDLFNDPGDRP